MTYQRRIVDDILDELFPHLDAVALEGAKAVGKTETARQRARTVLALDDELTRESVSMRPRTIRELETPVLIDEWQLVPSTWDSVRRAVDDGAAGEGFLLAGSAEAPSAARIHTGAGRIVSLRMRPLSFAERGLEIPVVSLRALLGRTAGETDGRSSVELEDYAREIIVSGFPGLRGLPPRARRIQLESYIERIVARELPENGMNVRKPASIRSWLAAYGAATATTASYSGILDAATPAEQDKPSRITVGHYRDYLTRVFVLEPLEAWTPALTPLKRLTQAPKHHLVDPSLAAHLVGIEEAGLLTGEGGRAGAGAGLWLGALFESLVTQAVRVYADSAEARVYHLRTKSTEREIDLIVEGHDRSVVAIEVKLAGTVGDTDVRHLHWLESQIGDRLAAKVVVTTGPVAYQREDGVHVVPLSLLGP
ncbi:ATP-binding protein [Zhihengliuella salsuginis]|uniref:ATPase AAA n=1 Tax=Zhihengliuella salsuginis TaxID=578222 RepID=A0ABQ3GJ19_9MICC|nr:DUF4143 domain-containing protein [Zhihengliuella salsuginis]GHD06336.1 ATPase AAA [Zhihengliuella salsuginis]